MAATLTNLAKQVQGLQTLAHAQVALTDVFLKYVITCVVEPPEDALPAASTARCWTGPAPAAQRARRLGHVPARGLGCSTSGPAFSWSGPPSSVPPAAPRAGAGGRPRRRDRRGPRGTWRRCGRRAKRARRRARHWRRSRSRPRTRCPTTKGGRPSRPPRSWRSRATRRRPPPSGPMPATSCGHFATHPVEAPVLLGREAADLVRLYLPYEALAPRLESRAAVATPRRRAR